MSSFYTNFFMRGNYVYISRVDNGVKSRQKVEVRPTLYAKDTKKISNESTDNIVHVDMYGNSLTPFNFETPYKARQFINSYEGVEGFDILGFDRFEYVKIDELFPSKPEQVGVIDYNISILNVAFIDIETKIGDSFAKPSDPHQEINAITLLVNSVSKNNGKMKTWSLYDIDNVDSDSVHIFCKSEEELLLNFISEWRDSQIDIVSGWNTSGFDLPYIAKRVERVLGDEYVKSLSPWGLYSYYEDTDKYGGEQLKVKLHGISDLDMIELYRKFVLKKQESYSLNHISIVELGEHKIEYEGTLKDLYTLDPERFIRYNQQDVRLVQRINDKVKGIETAILIAYISKTNFEDSFSTMRPWDCIIGNYLKNKNIHVPITKKGDKTEKFKGAIVKEPVSGRFPWVVSFDFETLYTSIIRQYNISPETFIDNHIQLCSNDIKLENEKYIQAFEMSKDMDATLTSNGSMYSREKKGVIPLLIGNMFDKRKSEKKKMIEWGKCGEMFRGEFSRRKKLVDISIQTP